MHLHNDELAQAWNVYNDVHYTKFLSNQTVSEDENRLDTPRHCPMMVAKKPITCIEPRVQTLHDMFMSGHALSKDKNCLGWRSSQNSPYNWLTYDQVLMQVKEFGSGLIVKGATQKELIGIYSQNRVEWKVTEQACNSYSMVIVPLYDTLGKEAIEYIVSHCELKIIVVDTPEKANLLLTCVQEGKFKLELLITMFKPTDELVNFALPSNVTMMSFYEVKELGKLHIKNFLPPKPQDLHTICFTSGTTGKPKGVMLSHKNFVANIVSIYILGRKDFFKMSQCDIYISYLPLAHVFERVCQGICFNKGASIGYFQGDVKLLLDDVKTLRPTCFPMVPRLINRLILCLLSFVIFIKKTLFLLVDSNIFD